MGFKIDSTSGSAMSFKLTLYGMAVFQQTIIMSTGNPGYIKYHSQADAGPVFLNPKGYLPVTYVPTQAGDYSIDFQLAAASSEIAVRLIDITVIDTTKSPLAAINGRLWSRDWGFDTYSDGVPTNAFLATQYILTEDSIVTSLDYNHMRGWNFDVTSTRNGCFPWPEPWDSSCRSRPGNHHYSQYQIFVNNPDSNEYPTGTVGTILGDTVEVVSGCNGTFGISFNVNKPGNVKLDIKVSPIPGFQPEDVALNRGVTAGFNSILWNGRNGLGNPVPCGDSVGMTINYINGLTNVALYDVEKNLNGFIIKLVRPSGPPIACYWNDTLLAKKGGQLQLDGCYSALPDSGCHTWNGGAGSGLGSMNTVNTWWYAATSELNLGRYRVNCIPHIPRSISGPDTLCRDIATTYTVDPDPLPGTDSMGYEWVLTNEAAGQVLFDTVNTGPAFTVTISDPAVSHVRMKVRGHNSHCGYGPFGPDSTGAGKLIPVYSSPELTNSLKNFTICSGDTTDILLQSTIAGTAFSYTCQSASPFITGQSAGNQNPIRQKLINSGNSIDSVFFKIVPFFSPCSGDTTIFAVRVIPTDSVIIPVTVSANPACDSAEVIFSVGTFSGNPAASYTWTVNGTVAGSDSSVFSYRPVNGDKVKCKVTSPDLCTPGKTGYSEEVDMTVMEKVAVSLKLIPDRNPVCRGEPVTLTADTGNAGSSPAYQWKVNANIANNAGNAIYTYVPADSDRVSCVMTSGLACVINREAADSVLIRVQGDHKLVDTLLCYGVPYFAEGKWQTAEGVYYDTLASPVSCIRFIETKLAYKPRIPVELGSDTTVCGGMLVLNAAVPGGTYLWQDGSYDSLFLVTRPGMYHVTISFNGCSQQDSIHIDECPPVLWIPNAFTPDGDGVNDLFSVRGLGIEDFSMKIYNRWGEMIFRTASLDQGWDGNYRGSRCPEGAYVYVITYKGNSGTAGMEKGTIILNR